MSTGCSSSLLSTRPSDASVQLRAYHFQLQEMGTQRFDLPCGFSGRDAPRAAFPSEKPYETRGSCSLRCPITPSPSILAKAAQCGGRREEIVEGGIWERARSVKRFREISSSEDPSPDRAKRTRTGSTHTQLVDGCDELWFPQFIEEPPLVEGDVCFFPNSAISPFIECFGSEEEFDTGEGTNGKIHLYSGSSSDDHGSSPELTWDFFENGNEPPAYFPSGLRGWDENTQTENQGLELVSLLISCVESISFGDHASINYFLARLGELASPIGTPIHRVIAYFTEALALRAVKLWPHVFTIAPPRELADQIADDDDIAIRALNHTTPIPKFIHFTLNERLLSAFEGKDRVHIIDFDIKQGLQWPGLLQSLASRPNPPSHVRITGIGASKQDLNEMGDRLAGLADALNLPFEFHPVVDRLEDVRLWMLHVKERECVAVNCVLQLHKVLYDDTGRAIMDLLALIRSTNPEIVLIAEHEAEHNNPRWETRVAYSLKYYSAMFDSLDSSLAEDSPLRIKVEEMFAREIRNIVAYEGSERVERHESFGKWRELMEGNSFRCAGIGEREILQSRLVLRMYTNQNYSIDKQGERDDGLTLKWSDQPLYTVSGWAPVDIAGSSTTSQRG